MDRDNDGLKILKFILDNYNGEEDNAIFRWGLKLLKTSGSISEIDRDSLQQLIDMIPTVSNINDRAALIEVILESECFSYDDDKKLLDEYVYLLSENASSIKDAITCLNDFIASGADKNDVFNKVARKLNEKKYLLNEQKTIKLLMGINEEWEKVPNDLEKYFNEVKEGKIINYRSFVVSTFLLIVHPLCSKYAHINSVSDTYGYLLAAISDWGWSKPGSTNHLSDRKIITRKEGEILEHLGALLLSNIAWNSEEIRKLYYDFFNDKNPIDVMFTLPE